MFKYRVKCPDSRMHYNGSRQIDTACTSPGINYSGVELLTVYYSIVDHTAVVLAASHQALFREQLGRTPIITHVKTSQIKKSINILT